MKQPRQIIFQLIYDPKEQFLFSELPSPLSLSMRDGALTWPEEEEPKNNPLCIPLTTTTILKNTNVQHPSRKAHHAPMLLFVQLLHASSSVIVLLLDQTSGEEQADDQETQSQGSTQHDGYSLRCLLPSEAAAMGNAVGVVAVGNVALVKVHLAGGRAAALDLDVLHGLCDATAAVDIGEVALALRQGVDLLVAGGEEAAGGGAGAALELREGGVPAHLEVAVPAAGAAGLEEHLGAGDLGEAGDLVEREAAVELDPRRDGGPAELGPGGHGAGDAGGAVGPGEVAAALEEAEDGGGGRDRRMKKKNTAAAAAWILGMPPISISLSVSLPSPHRHSSPRSTDSSTSLLFCRSSGGSAAVVVGKLVQVCAPRFASSSLFPPVRCLLFSLRSFIFLAGFSQVLFWPCHR